MLHRWTNIWTIVVITVILCWSVVSNVYGQNTLNLITGMSFQSHRTTYNDNTLSGLPNGFFKLGLGYTSKDNISVSLDYAFDVKVFNLTSIIPLWAFNKRKYKSFALLNNNNK